MKASWITAVLAGAVFSAVPAFAETTVTVSGNDTVAVSQPGTTYVTSDQPSSPSEYDFEGEIVQIDQPEARLIVRDQTPHDRRITGDRGIVSTLKVGDYVKVDLRHGSETEAAHIVETRPSATTRVVESYPASTTVVQTR